MNVLILLFHDLNLNLPYVGALHQLHCAQWGVVDAPNKSAYELWVSQSKINYFFLVKTF